MAERLVAGRRGDRSLAAHGRPGELLGADLWSLVLPSGTVDDPASSSTDRVDHPLYVAGTSLERLAVDGVAPGFDLTLNGVDIATSERASRTGRNRSTPAEDARHPPRTTRTIAGETPTSTRGTLSVSEPRFS